MNEHDDKSKEALKKMDILNNDIYDIKINTWDIISKAETIKNKKHERKEFTLFITVCIFLMSLMAFMTDIFGIHFLLYFETIVYILSPFSILPLSIIAVKKGGTKNE